MRLELGFYRYTRHINNKNFCVRIWYADNWSIDLVNKACAEPWQKMIQRQLRLRREPGIIKHKLNDIVIEYD